MQKDTTSKRKTTHKNTHGEDMKAHKKSIVLGVIAAGALAGAATYYFYGSRKAEDHRENFKEWFKNAREEVLTEARKLKDAAFNKQNYAEIVRSVGKRYQDLKKFDSEDVLDFIKVVGAEWKQLGDKVKNKVQKTKRTVKNTTELEGGQD